MVIDKHECFLGDNGTLDTVIIIDDKEYRLSDTSWVRDKQTGGMTEWGFKSLCEEIIEEL